MKCYEVTDNLTTLSINDCFVCGGNHEDLEIIALNEPTYMYEKLFTHVVLCANDEIGAYVRYANERTFDGY